MTTFKHPRGKTWRYDFVWRPPGWPAGKPGKRETGSTGQLTKKDADLVEADIKLKLRRQAYGIVPFDRMQTPSFTAWAAQHFEYVRKRGKAKRLDAVEQMLRLCLQFWGRRPSRPRGDEQVSPRAARRVAEARARDAGAPYHDLRLADPILEPAWIERFEDWLTSLGLSGSRKNHYRSAMSGLYRTALLPAYRSKTRVTQNPFRHIERDVVPSRTAVLSLEQLRAFAAAAAPHTRLAMAIAVYAPELREGSILQLRWREHLDRGLTRITTTHKTERWTGRPQVVPIGLELRAILEAVRQAQPSAEYVVTYRGEPVRSLKTGLRNAARRANRQLPADEHIVYGAKRGGVTFHTIRHTMATLLAEWGVPEAIRQMLMGHRSIATTQKYTHLAGLVKTGPLQQLATNVDLLHAMTAAAPVPVRGKDRQPRKRRSA